MRTEPKPVLGARFEEALAYAAELHRTQFRKGTAIPYISHLLAVCALVLEHGGSEDEAIAAVLHDAVEDQGGPPTLDEIRRRFGDRVASIVAACSDTDKTPKPPWRERKQAYIDHLREEQTSDSILLVSACDKLHNLRAIVADYERIGAALWDRFNEGAEEQVWYYGELLDAFAERKVNPSLVEALPCR